MKTIVTRLYDQYEDAAAAVADLKRSGISEADISMVANRESYPDDATASANGTSTGAGVGGAVGAGAGLLAGIGLMAIPGLGPVVAAGWLAATALGAVAGAVTGGVIGMLVDAGVSENDAHVYAEGVRRGGTLVTVRTEDRETADRILGNHISVDVNERRLDYSKTGWKSSGLSDGLS